MAATAAGGGGTASAANRPHFRPVLLLPTRMAILPVPLVAALIEFTWPALRLLVRAAAPPLVVLMDGNLMRTAPTEPQVPL